MRVTNIVCRKSILDDINTNHSFLQNLPETNPGIYDLLKSENSSNNSGLRYLVFTVVKNQQHIVLKLTPFCAHSCAKGSGSEKEASIYTDRTPDSQEPTSKRVTCTNHRHPPQAAKRESQTKSHIESQLNNNRGPTQGKSDALKAPQPTETRRRHKSQIPVSRPRWCRGKEGGPKNTTCAFREQRTIFRSTG